MKFIRTASPPFIPLLLFTNCVVVFIFQTVLYYRIIVIYFCLNLTKITKNICFFQIYKKIHTKYFQCSITLPTGFFENSLLLEARFYFHAQTHWNLNFTKSLRCERKNRHVVVFGKVGKKCPQQILKRKHVYSNLFHININLLLNSFKRRKYRHSLESCLNVKIIQRRDFAVFSKMSI